MKLRPARFVRKEVKPRLDAIGEFIQGEAIGGVVLMAATILALLWANSQWGDSYFSLWDTELTVNFGIATITHDLQHWVNDALMVVFFFIVALEIKRELVGGELSERKAAITPLLVATGGVLVPALIFTAITWGSGEASNGWAIPVATDIAFVVGILALLTNRVSAGLKLFFISFAIVDDIIAIVIIAIFYTEDLSAMWMAVMIGSVLAILLMRRLGVANPWWYLPIGVFFWLATSESGIHATVAGVALGLMVPAGVFRGRKVLETLEHHLHPISSYFIVPVFALANAGVVLSLAIIGDAATTTLAWGIVLGLVVGKFIGIGGTSWLVARFNIGTMPEGVTLRHTWALAGLSGIGFTMSLFITQLSFDSETLMNTAKIGIFTGSIISAIIGTILILRFTRPGEGVETTAEPGSSSPVALPNREPSV